MQTNRLFLLFSGLLFLSLSCQQTPEYKGPILFGDLYVRFLQDTDEVKATATFVLGDSLQVAVPFRPEGGVAFQGGGMGGRAITERLYRYNWENTLKYPEQFQFSFKNQNGAAQQFSGTLSPITQVSLPKPLSLRQGGRVHIQAPIAENEKVVLLFNSSDNTSKSITLSGPIPDGQLQLSAEQLKSLTPGAWTLFLVKKQLQVFSQAEQEITLSIEFYAQEQQVEVVE
ncbi:MAG: hypothetical protein KDC44_05245 [Phaeodactylibacter sp.]|nr:hypothetical protein [Phaeodactylibacter sp.]